MECREQNILLRRAAQLWIVEIAEVRGQIEEVKTCRWWFWLYFCNLTFDF
jgi:hypothetical protein